MATTTENDSTLRQSSDVFSMTDDALASRYKFEKENGVGNWGSVWAGFDKRSTNEEVKKVAIKVVHRSKTATTAARVRALWNEMKVVHPFKEEGGHTSIVGFECFIITPSYALIVMDFLPNLLPVKVEEKTAKQWFAMLASAVDFMHKRGVVHNDIKPANILLSSTGIPTFVDFGFSERYDLTSPTSSSPVFRSSLAYGTPEYLSPERARGLTHDPRKSDIWSLGVTFFEIMTGRTPFEHEHGEQFTSKEELEVYWSRTMKGKWVGREEGWKKFISPELGLLLKKMLEPNADVRFTAEEVLKDPYWTIPSTHKVQKRPSKMKITSGTPQNKISSAMRTILGDRQNVPTPNSTSIKVATEDPLRPPSGEDENGSGKENVPPRIRKQASKVSESLVTPPGLVSPTNVGDQRKIKSSFPAAQEAARVKEIAADNQVDRMAIWVKNVDQVVEDAKTTFTRDTSQLLPSLPTLHKPDQPSQSTSPFSRPRANDIFPPLSSNNMARRPIGNTADLNAPHSLRHAVSANYPFNAGNIDGVGQKVVVSSSTREVRRIKSELATCIGHHRPNSTRESSRGRLDANHKGHKKSPSYNSMYLGHSRMVSMPIPEVRVEDVDDPNREKSLVVHATEDNEVYYEQLLAGSNAVERVGKGYQSNLCTRNDSTTQKKTLLPSITPGRPESKRLPPSSFFMTVRERGNPARPQRKMRQAASFDGFANIRPRTREPMAVRPVSANLDINANQESAPAPTPSPAGKKKSSVTGTMRKAFLALLGGGEKLGKST